MKLSFIDTHTHVHFSAYKEDMEEVIARAFSAGVGMITVGTQTTTSKNAVELAGRHEGIWATIGLHPNHLHAQEFYDSNELPPEEQPTGKIKTRAEVFRPEDYEELVKHPKVVAIGEFGLDYYRIPEHLNEAQVKEDQKRSCQRQLAFASTYEKPVVIHCRDAHADQYALLKAEMDRGGLQKRGVIHCFTGTGEDAKRYAELGFLLGLNGILTFAKELQEVVRELPLEQIVLETDAPYLTPAPYRGKRNESSYLPHVAEVLAELKGLSVDEVANITTGNAKKLFDLSI